MTNDYSENVLIQDSAGNLLRDELGWQVLDWQNPVQKLIGKKAEAQ